jgi:tRNA pseudouridine13 synthase
MTDVPRLVRASGESSGRARIRTTPEDFQVREWLGFAADGDGEHMLVTVRKRESNTMWVAKQLGRMASVAPRDVGFAGLKDRHAVTEQSFSLPARSKVGDAWQGLSGEGFEVIAAARHRRKLKRGSHRANDFSIVLRDFDGDLQKLREKVASIGKMGVPNYFGPQRFGIDGGNLALANRWFVDGNVPADRYEQGFALSAARSAIFNSVLAARVADGTWNQLEAGDVANLNGTGSIFDVSELDDTLRDRCRALDVHPSGPMWGRGELRSRGRIRDGEQGTADGFAAWCAGLERAGLSQERRALRLAIDQLNVVEVENGIKLEFRLPRGAFATTLLHELLDVVDSHSEGDE